LAEIGVKADNGKNSYSIESPKFKKEETIFDKMNKDGFKMLKFNLAKSRSKNLIYMPPSITNRKPPSLENDVKKSKR